MDEPTDRKRSAAARFDEHADAYLDSRVHSEGDDLDQLAEWVGAADRAIDVATGAGHTAGALVEAGAERVVAADAAPEMVATTRAAVPGVDGAVCDAERLPFATDAFDAATCRIAAHHFPDPAAFVSEVARILEPGGTFAFEDNVAPDDDTLDEFLNTVERTRDPTHVRSHRVGDWHEWLDAAGFTVEHARVVTKRLGYDDWVENADPPPQDRRRLRAVFDDRPPGATELFEIVESDGTVDSFVNLKLLLCARR